MYLLYCDESNLQHRAGDFLVYGGVIIPADRAASLSLAIDDLRNAAGIEPSAELKFNPLLPPLDHHGYRNLKQKIIQTAIDHGCIMIAYVVLHDLAGDPNQARRYGINTV